MTVPTLARAILTVVVVALAGCGGGTEAETVSRGPSGGVPIPGGGLTVSEVIASDLEGPLQVKGYVIDGRLCEAILESEPPQCGEPSLRIEGELPQAAPEEQVSLLGTVEDGTFVLSETST